MDIEVDRTGEYVMQQDCCGHYVPGTRIVRVPDSVLQEWQSASYHRILRGKRSLHQEFVQGLATMLLTVLISGIAFWVFVGPEQIFLGGFLGYLVLHAAMKVQEYRAQVKECEMRTKLLRNEIGLDMDYERYGVGTPEDCPSDIILLRGEVNE
jgi:hypothetical protein